LRRSFCELIKDVKVSFVEDLSNDTILLEQIVCNVCTDWFALSVELYLKVLSVPGGLVVSKRFGTSEALEEGICRENHVFDFLDLGRGSARDICNVLHDSFGGFRLAGS
jgi:hypothetical protein